MVLKFLGWTCLAFAVGLSLMALVTHDVHLVAPAMADLMVGNLALTSARRR